MLSLPPAHRLPPTPVPSIPLVSRQHACIYIPCMQRHLFRPAVHLKLAPPLSGGCLLSCSYPSLQSLYILYIPLYIHVIISCISTRALHLVNLTSCTSRAYLVHLYVCTSSRVHLYACTSSRVHLHTCTSPREPHLVHIYVCTSSHVHLISRAPHLVCTSRASFALVHQLTSCTHQAHPPSRWTWTIPLATVTFWPSALSISHS